MKILFVTNFFPPDFRGGYEMACVDFAESFHASGHAVCVACPTSVAHRERTNFARTFPFPVRRIFLPTFSYDDAARKAIDATAAARWQRTQEFSGYVEANCIALANVIDDFGPDLVWFFNPLGLGPIGLLETAHAFEGKKVLITLMEDVDGVIACHATDESNFTHTWEWLKARTTAISCSKKILECNESVGRYKDHHVVYNALRASVFGAHGERPAAPSSAGKLRLVYFGQISEAKGVFLLMNHVARYSEESPSRKAYLDLIGPGEPDAIALARTMVADNPYLAIRDPLPKKELLASLAGYDAGAFLLSNSEPFAYAPMEAIANGLPIILSRGTGNAEILDPSNPLLLRDRNNYREFKRVLDLFFDAPETIVPLAADMRKAVDENLVFEKHSMPKLLSVIDAIEGARGYAMADVFASAQMMRHPVPIAQRHAPCESPRGDDPFTFRWSCRHPKKAARLIWANALRRLRCVTGVSGIFFL